MLFYRPIAPSPCRPIAHAIIALDLMKFTILEPMSTGDVIDRTVRLYRRNFTPLIAIVAVPTLIGYAVSLMFWYGYSNVVMNTANRGAMQADAVIMMLLGMGGYP